jgi:hypothetical protein
MNRLKLDFSLKTNEERTNFITQYLNSEMFQKKPPTTEELETMSNYILWGIDSKTGLNSKQSKEIQLETRNKTWDARRDESLEALLETPGFSETIIRQLDTPQTKTQRVVFSRSEARQKASPAVLEQLESLWKQIDELDLLLNFYDLAHGKRKNQPREALLQRFTDNQIQNIQERVPLINSYKYLKMRHLLVELRREQFILKDTYSSPILCAEVSTPISSPPTFDSEILCAPLGLKYKDKMIDKLFPKDRYPLPEDFSEEELNSIIKFYWKRKEELSQQKNLFDFRNMDHIYNTLLLFDTFEDDAKDTTILSTSPEFLDTLNFYINRANLNEIHLDILHLKLKHLKNQKIADKINEKYGKSYTANYISTIFCQKIIPQINDAARYHEKIIENLPFPENFKCCKCCGEKLLVSPENFVRKARSVDGFANKCKRCDKDTRQNKKSLKEAHNE